MARRTASQYWKRHWEDLGTNSLPALQMGWSTFNQGELIAYLKDIHQGLFLDEKDILLDIGCNNGLISAYLSILCAQVRAFDYSRNLIVKARENFNKIPGLRFYVKDINKIPFGKAGKFFVGAVFQYLDREKAQEFLRKVGRSSVERGFISHVPWLDKKSTFLNGYKKFIRNKEELKAKIKVWDEHMTWYGPEDFNILQGHFNVDFRQPNDILVPNKYAMNVILERKRKQ